MPDAKVPIINTLYANHINKALRLSYTYLYIDAKAKPTKEDIHIYINPSSKQTLIKRSRLN